MGFRDIEDTKIIMPKDYEDFSNFRIDLEEPLYSDKEVKKITREHEEILTRLREEYRTHVKIGKIATVFYPNDMKNIINELFFVIGFQPDIYGRELVVALMDSNFKTFLVNIDNIVIKEFLTIDDMFPPKSIYLCKGDH